MIWERHFPFRAVGKPKVASKGVSWHVRARHFKRFRDTVHLLIGATGPELQFPVSVRIAVYDWNPREDPDTVAAGVLDCLKTWPLLDDSWKYVAHLSIFRNAEPEDGGGFTVTIENWTPWGGEHPPEKRRQ